LAAAGSGGDVMEIDNSTRRERFRRGRELTDKDRSKRDIRIMILHDQGMSLREIGNAVNLSKAHTARIVQSRSRETVY
jgi:hypothetical protein